MTKLLVVDVQNDFCEGGSLACPGGRDVAHRVEEYLVSRGATYTEVVASRDWHDPATDNGGHFSETPNYADTWPPHCVRGTPGADFAFNSPFGIFINVVSKGMNAPAYSAVEAEGFTPDPNEVYHVCGIATDYCVKATVMDLLRADASVTVLSRLCVGVTEDGHAAALDEMREAGATIL